MTKLKLRKELKEKLNKQNNTQRLRKSRLIKEKLFRLAEFKKAEYVMFYIATDKEVQTDFMIAEARKIGKKVVVPVILKGEKILPAPLDGKHLTGPDGRRRIIASLLEDSKKIASGNNLNGQFSQWYPLNTFLYHEKELESGPYGILQPQSRYIREMPAEKIDLAVVPGLAFDKSGRRLGRGGGYYDKFLAGLPLVIPRIGLAFDFQLIKDIPVLSHDVCVTRVISA